MKGRGFEDDDEEHAVEKPSRELVYHAVEKSSRELVYHAVEKSSREIIEQLYHAVEKSSRELPRECCENFPFVFLHVV